MGWKFFLDGSDILYFAGNSHFLITNLELDSQAFANADFSNIFFKHDEPVRIIGDVGDVPEFVETVLRTSVEFMLLEKEKYIC